MTQEHSSKLSFSIEESVWLNKDQEVDEILSLSLDPDITIQEHGEYVMIRGGLKLTGEYRPKEKDDDYTEEALSQQVAFRSIEEVITHEDGTSEIKHTFPIDVTIPQERINSLDDIYVIVESFDYDLPERGCIQLTADVAITGMATGYEARTRKEDYEVVSKHEEDRTFHFEATKQAEEESEEFLPRDVMDEDEYTDTEYEYSESESAYQIEEDQTEEVEEDDIEEVEEERYGELDLEEVEEEVVAEDRTIEEQSPAIAFGVKQVTEQTKEQVEKKEVAQKSFSMLTNLTKDRPKEDSVIQLEEVEETIAEVEENVDTQQEVKPREENALYLTKMLSKDEEQFSKLKMCIVQTNETLEIIATRYKVNISTLIHVNKLSDDQVEEGQILYIPVKKA